MARITAKNANDLITAADQNALQADYVSQTDTTAQTIASKVTFTGGTANAVKLAPSYTVYKSGSTYYAMDEDGTATSNAALHTLLNGVVAADKTFYFKPGAYTLSGDVPIAVSNIHFVGSGWSTVFNVLASSGFSFAHTDIIGDFMFRDIYFYGGSIGSPVADYAIRSTGMADGKRLNRTIIDHCFFYNFHKAGAIPVQLHNPELCWITRSDFYRTNTSLLKLTTNDYDSGNLRIWGNRFIVYATNDTSSAIHIEPLANDGTNGGFGSIHLDSNQYLSTSTLSAALNIVCTSGNGTVRGIFANKERCEGVGYIKSTGADAGQIDRANIADSWLYSAVANQVEISLDANTENFHFDNCIIEANGAGATALSDSCIQNVEYNKFSDCHFRGGTISASSKTLFENCKFGSTTPRIVRTIGVDNWRLGSFMCSHAATAKTIVSATDYIARNCDWLVAVSGGTKTATIIKDASGTQSMDFGAADCCFILPHLFQFRVVFSVQPTVTVTPLL